MSYEKYIYRRLTDIAKAADEISGRLAKAGKRVPGDGDGDGVVGEGRKKGAPATPAQSPRQTVKMGSSKHGPGAQFDAVVATRMNKPDADGFTMKVNGFKAPTQDRFGVTKGDTDIAIGSKWMSHQAGDVGTHMKTGQKMFRFREVGRPDNARIWVGEDGRAYED